MGKKTPLYDVYGKYGGKIISFGGYLLPVQFQGILEEHMAVRTAVGLFDVSHMGEITCKGKDALAFLNRVLTNDYTSLKTGSARYSLMCNDKGGIVDDLIVYKVADEDYFVVVNAATKDKDYAWMQGHVQGDCQLADVSDQYIQLALQGPKAEEVLRRLLSDGAIPKKPYTAKFHVDLQGTDTLVSRTGYTGEDGFELYFAVPDAEKIWNLLLETGRPYGIQPCGLGARDTLRMEAAMPLYGQEMSGARGPESDGPRHRAGAHGRLGRGEAGGTDHVGDILPLCETSHCHGAGRPGLCRGGNAVGSRCARPPCDSRDRTAAVLHEKKMREGKEETAWHTQRTGSTRKRMNG